MKVILLMVAIFIFHPLFAQMPGADRDTLSSVIVNKDFRFDEMAAKQAELNKHALRTGPRRVSGFRIQVVNSQNRDEANAVKAELLRRFPDQKCYLLYQSPNFKVRIGNFLTQREAFQLRKTISALYPQNGIYIVPDVVEY
ncbi:MAG: SPOR domain-containing protein, partial [Bacteroidota bacterium]|nr:SPOR domain-containing protein [Bacteroidota bacterium]